MYLGFYFCQKVRQIIARKPRRTVQENTHATHNDPTQTSVAFGRRDTAETLRSSMVT